MSIFVDGQNSASSAGRYYRPELDVVRFLAFLLVFIRHTLPNSTVHSQVVDRLFRGFAPAFYASIDAGRFGLSLFFTLSAFLICELLLREREITGKIEIKQFYIRRILRIWPLYYLGLALGLLAAFLPGGHPDSAIVLAWFAVFLGAWHSCLFGWIHNPASPLWSISVEEQFYLFAPWAVKFFNRKSLYGFCALLILAANFRLYFLGRIGAPDYAIWADSFVQFECFAAGILLCLFLHGRLPRLVLWQRLVLLVGVFSCWFLASYKLPSAFFYASGSRGSRPLIGGYALGTLGSTLLLVAFLGINPKLLPGWAVYLGRISFGLYVYHEFALHITNMLPTLGSASMKGPNLLLQSALGLGLTILMAALSYRYFEAPFLRMKKRHAIIQSQPISDAG